MGPPLRAQLHARLSALLTQLWAQSAASLPSPAELGQGALCVEIVYGVALLLHCLVPSGPPFSGYVLAPDGRTPLRYRLNGLRVLLTMVVLPLPTGLHSCSYLWGPALARSYRGTAVASCLLGLLLSLLLYLRGRARHARGAIDLHRRCATVATAVCGLGAAAGEEGDDSDDSDDSADGADGADGSDADGSDAEGSDAEGESEQGDGGGMSLSAVDGAPCPEFAARGPLAHFYCGFEWNPRYLGRFEVDGKMFLYLAGAVMLALHILSAASLHQLSWDRTANGLPVSNAMAVYVGCFGWFLVEYLYFEDVHTFTCACFHAPPPPPPTAAAAAALIFRLGLF
jgi:hypothetical protein